MKDCQLSAPSGLIKWVNARARWRDGDLAWLGLLLSVASAFLMVGLVWWLVS